MHKISKSSESDMYMNLSTSAEQGKIVRQELYYNHRTHQ